MADDPHNTSDISDTVDLEGAKEDAETTAARRELKQTSISEKAGQDDNDTAHSSQEYRNDDTKSAAADKPPARTPSPENNAAPKLDHRDLRERVSSPKKKRGHDELDGTHEGSVDSPNDDEASETAAASTTIAAKSRTVRSEPEKKRPRDRQADEEARNSQDEEEPRSADSSARSSLEQQRPDPAPEAKKANDKNEKPKTSTSFASSAFGKLASGPSPFSALGGSSGASKPSLFGGAGAAPSGFGALGGASKPTTTSIPSAPPKLSFGGAAASSPFGAMNGSAGKPVFGGGSGFGGGGSTFGSSVLGGPRLSSFAKPGDALKSDKPERAFGAPDSDAEEESGDEGQESGNEDGDKSDKEEEKKARKETIDEEKKVKLRKVVVDNGESNEVTLLVVRAKMFQIEKGEGWKERGAGMLKVNVPRASVDFDDAGNPIPGSFDASVLDEDDETCLPQNVRLIMRQDHTLRVILNTPIVPAMSFRLDKKLKASFILFTAFDGSEAKQVQLKMSDANATAFTQLLDLVKRQLSDV